MDNKNIIRAIQRVHSEKLYEIERNMKRLHELGHQIMYFSEMYPSYQNIVLENLWSDMNQYKWGDWVKELKKEKITSTHPKAENKPSSSSENE